MTVFSYTGTNRALSSGDLEERGLFSYSPSSVVLFESEDYGLINEFVSYYDDFGSINDEITSNEQIFNYGSITRVLAERPFGRLKITREFADLILTRVSVGGLTMLAFGEALVQILPLVFGTGVYQVSGTALQKQSPLQTGSGTLFGLGGSANAFGPSPSDETGVRITLSGGASHAFSRGNYEAEGTLFGFNSASIGRIAIVTPDPELFKVTGSAVEKHVENYVGTGRLRTPVGDAIVSASTVDDQRVVYSYNTSSVVKPASIDYGFITQLPTNITGSNVIFDYQDVQISTYANEIVSEFGDPIPDNYGFVNDNVANGFPDRKLNYGLITENETILPFGLFDLQSATTIGYAPNYNSVGHLHLRGEARIFVLPIHIGGGEFTITDSAGIVASLSHKASGTFSAFSGAAESTAVLSESKGLFAIDGSAEESIAPAPHIGSGSAFAFTGAGIGRVAIVKPDPGLFKFHGSAVEKNTENYVGRGSLFAPIGDAEVNATVDDQRVVYSYNSSSVVRPIGEDYGFVRENATNIDNSNVLYDYQDELISTYANEIVSEFGDPSLDDYGFITLPVSFPQPSNQENYGFIEDNETRLPFGLFDINSDTLIKVGPSYVGSGHFLADGEARIFVLPIHIGGGEFTITDTAGIVASLSHVGTGQFSAFTGAAESTAVLSESKGLFAVQGGADEAFVPATHVASGQFSAFTGAGIVRVAIVKPEPVLFQFHGSAIEKHTEDYVGRGSLYAIIGEADVNATTDDQRVTFSYNTSSRVTFPSEDYGFVRENATNIDNSNVIFDYQDELISTYANEIVSQFGEPSLDDYGFITSPVSFPQPSNQENYGFITDTENLFPFGLFNLESTTHVVQSPAIEGDLQVKVFGDGKVQVLPRHIGVGEFTIGGAADPVASLSHVGSGVFSAFTGAAEAVALVQGTRGDINFEGEAAEAFAPAPHIGSGTLFAFEGSANAYSARPESDGLFKFHGSAGIKNIARIIGSGSLFGYIGNADVDAVFADERIVYSYNDSSRVGLESEDYGLVSELPANTELDATIADYANVPISTYANEIASEFGRVPNDYGFIQLPTNFAQQRDDYGLITDNETRLPFGGIKFSTKEDDSALVLITANYGGEGFTRVASGAGDVRIFGYAGDGHIHVGHRGPGDTAQIRFSLRITNVGGTLFGIIGGTEALTPAPITGSGVLRFGGSAGLKVTQDYVGTGTYRAGLSSPGVIGDGSRGITTFHLAHVGSGKADIDGTAQTPRARDFVGSGSLFAFTGSAESSTKVEEKTSLFKFAGTAQTPRARDFVGSGSLFTFVSKTETTSTAEFSTGLFKVTGNAVLRATQSYVGTGVFSAFTGAAEVFAATPPVSGLFKVQGSAAEAIVPAPEIGSGSLFTFVSKTETFSAAEKPPGTLFKTGGVASIGFSLTEFGGGVFNLRQKKLGLDASEKPRYISGIERQTFSTATEGGLFRVAGKVKLFFTYFDTGGGEFTLAGKARTQTRPIHEGSGRARINGIANTPFPRAYKGSGSAFGFIGGVTVAASRPPVTGTLFRFEGASVEKNTEAYNGATELQATGTPFINFSLRHIGSGVVGKVGDGAEARTIGYKGTGTLFGISATTDSRLVDTIDKTTLFRFAGAGSQRSTAKQIGSGGLFAFVSKTEIRVASPESNGLFKISGVAQTPRARDFVGSGTFDLNTKSAILDVNAKTVFISAEEKTVSIPPTTGTTFSFNGAAKTDPVRNYHGRGGLFGLGGGAEKVAFVPKAAVLFDFVGNATEKRTASHVGSGSLFTFDSRTESTVINSAASGIFSFVGSADVARSPAPHVGTGSLFAFVSKTETVTFSPPSDNLFLIRGSADVKKTNAFEGSGSVFTFVSTTSARVVPYQTQQGLFRVIGLSKESFIRTGYIGTTSIRKNGASADKYVEFEAPKPTRIYII
tara:strand:+ start:680 stop:6433 length:5754 start_codon:yes stop_codon:yes gene_type:complete